MQSLYFSSHADVHICCLCRDDAKVISQLYWQYTRPIRSMLMGLTPEDQAVCTHPLCLLRDLMPQPSAKMRSQWVGCSICMVLLGGG